MRLKRIAKEYAGDEAGHVTVTYALTLPVLLMVAGAATIYAHQVKTRTDLQVALDAGALAGAALSTRATEQDRIKAATAAFQANFSESLPSAGKNPANAAISDVTVRFSVANLQVTGEATASFANPFGGIIGTPELSVTVGSVGVKRESPPVCVLALDPRAAAGLEMKAKSQLTSQECAVQVNSDHLAAISQSGSPILSASLTGVTGGFTGSGYEPVPVRGVSPVEDPFARLSFPDHRRCDFEDKKITGGRVRLDPGVYCGGLHLTAGAKVTLKPGIYVFKNGPLWLGGNSQVEGDEVMVAFTGSKATLRMESNEAHLKLTSPAQGDYTNMQFVQEAGTGGDDLSFGIGGSSSLSFEGTLYLPTQSLRLSGQAAITASSPGFAIIAETIAMGDHARIDVNLENLRDLKVTALGRVRYGARLLR